MAERPHLDPLRLDPDGLAFHQLLTFSPEPPPLAHDLERSPLFTARRFGEAATADWVRWAAEEERSLFPLGRVTLHSQGVLLETFSEGRLQALRDRVDDLSAWKVSSDQLRVFRTEDVIERPSAILQPLQELAGNLLTPRDVAVLYLQMAWPFFPREDLSGRTPATVIHTGRGRTALKAILPKVPAELAREFPGFPDFSESELRHILLPKEPSGLPEAPEEKPHPADDRRRR